MMNLYKNIVLLIFILVAFGACKDQWEAHNEVTNSDLKASIVQQIRDNPVLAEFNEYLAATGYDSVLSSSKTFTVWAPTNEALQNLDQDIVKDPKKLKSFVSNHISFHQYFTHTPLPDSTSRIPTLSGKYIEWDKSSGRIEEITILEADLYAENGVLHIIDAPLAPKMNSWEFLTNTSLSPKQRTFMQSLTRSVFVDSLSVQIGVDGATGKPIYDSLQGMVKVNRFFQEAYDLSNEDSLNTFIMLTDNAFEAEYSKFEPYFISGTHDSTIQATSWGITKDLAFRGVYTPENLPDTLISKDGVKVHINTSDIERVERTSNGIVYVLNNLNVSPKDKLLPIVIEGESIYLTRNSVISHPDKEGAIRQRTRRNLEGEIFMDILAYNHDISGFYIRYKVPNVYATTYKVYMTTYNDFNGGVVYQQKVAFGDPTASELPYTDVGPFYQKSLLGEYTVDVFGYIDIYLVGAASTSDVVNPLNLDYLEMVPVF